MPDQVYRGSVLAGDDFEPIRAAVIVEDGVITAIEEDSSAPDRWICPAFFNAHTHLGDTVAMDCATGGDLEALVTPPHGLKHRILAATPRPRLIEGMRSSIGGMQATGTAGFADFREGGADGVTALREAVQGEPILPLIFGREGGETIADGIGISSARDIPDTEEQVRRARAAGRLVAFHAGEKDPDDIDAALCYDPDLLVHCTHATRGQLRAIADAGVPIAVCIRSNWTLGVTCDAGRPPVREMAACGCTWYIGTDNVMFVQPDMLREMSFCETVTRMPPEEILRAAVGGAALAGRSFLIKKGSRANFIIINPERAGLGFSPDPVASMVKRVGERSILQTVIN
ncbi:amidohydrolase family protein [Methanofollis tationis]|uniref:Amidohydrolase family protein n=1 Tax=Methanofollis tationis TaxID=81417 RepID=A0A7K4HLY8_9EURY|nr:amidohydrolase family protein [Methanofollis tationis]NVO66182.1 amidohydrolase family protein [Methanofollis tationis]